MSPGPISDSFEGPTGETPVVPSWALAASPAPSIPESEWEWYGLAGHFICGRWCRFHLCTLVGDHLVSTVGHYVHPRHGAGTERGEIEWLALNPDGEEIGLDRFYETMVFKAGPRCTAKGCACGQPAVDEQVDFEGYKDRKSATVGHRAMCLKWAKRDTRSSS